MVLLLAEKKALRKEPSEGVAVRSMPSRSALSQSPAEYWDRAEFVSDGFNDQKWTPLLLSSRERSLLEQVRSDAHFAAFAQLAEVDVGIVTGANKFFLVPDQVVKAFELAPWAHPMFGRSEHVAGIVYRQADHATNRSTGLPTHFLWFDAMELSRFPPAVQAYLRSGEAEGLPHRYKCRVRDPWFRVPSVYAAPVALLKRAHHYPRLILNQTGALTTDTAYRIKPKAGTDPIGLVYSFLNSLTCLCAELEGRHYGGGVLELVPSEIERLLLPKCPASAMELDDFDKRFRACSDSAQILQDQDQVVLAAAGLSSEERSCIHRAWDKLRQRRQRTPNIQSDSDSMTHGSD